MLEVCAYVCVYSVCLPACLSLSLSRFGLTVRRWVGKQKDLGSIPLRLSFLLKKVVVCGQCLVTLSLTINETLKRLSLLPILMQESFLVVTV